MAKFNKKELVVSTYFAIPLMSSDNKFCPACGTKLIGHSKFCPYCWEAL